MTSVAVSVKVLIEHSKLVKEFKQQPASAPGMNEQWSEYRSHFCSLLGYDAGNGWVDIDLMSIKSSNIDEAIKKILVELKPDFKK